ncbi:MAG: hypothetical protein LQ340_000511 [Diploschistes diacapsis]|nr:MAG: hypothetical protein LQ340_000511 [Diploschistes diacapsis]
MKVTAFLAAAILAIIPIQAQYDQEQHLVARDAVLEARAAYIDALTDLHFIEAHSPVPGSVVSGMADAVDCRRCISDCEDQKKNGRKPTNGGPNK